MSDLASRLAAAHAADAPYESLVAENPAATLADAYTTQRAFVDALDGNPIGYKGALTAAPAQAAMGIDDAVSGVLFDWGARDAGTTITSSRQVMLETELGFTLATDIASPVSAENVFAQISTCHPMIELAAPNLAGKTTGIDLVAANAASYTYIQGPGVPCGDLAVDELAITFTRDDEALHSASSGSVMEGQAVALTWLINHVLDVGYELRAGMLMMTGAIGAPHPGKPGSYQTEYGALGRIEFSLA